MSTVTSNPFGACNLTSQGASVPYGPAMYPEAVEFGNYFRQALPMFHQSELEQYYMVNGKASNFWLSPFYPTMVYDYQMARWPDGRIRIPIYTYENVKSSDEFNQKSSRQKVETLGPCDDVGNDAGLGNLCNRRIKYTTFKTGVRYVDGHLDEFHDRSEVLCLETFKRVQDKEAWWRNMTRALNNRAFAMRANAMRHLVYSTTRTLFSTEYGISNLQTVAQFGWPNYNPNATFILPSWRALQYIHSQMIADSGDGAEYIGGVPYGYMVGSPEILSLILQNDPDYREIWLNTGNDQLNTYNTLGTRIRTFSHWILREDPDNVRVKLVVNPLNGQTEYQFVSRTKRVANANGSGYTDVADPLYDQAEFEPVLLTFKNTHRRTISPEQQNTWAGVFGPMLGKEVSPLQWATALQAATGNYFFVQDNPLPLVEDCDDADNPFYNKGLFLMSFRQGILVENTQRSVLLLIPNPNRVCRPSWGVPICLDPATTIKPDGCEVDVRTFESGCDECSEGQKVELDSDMRSVVDICKTPNPTFRWTFCRKKCFTGAFTINYQTVDGTALAGTHYTATSGALTWADGEKGCKTIEVPITANPLLEDLNGLYMTVQLTVPNGVSVNCTQLTGVIHQPCNPCPQNPSQSLPLIDINQ